MHQHSRDLDEARQAVEQVASTLKRKVGVDYGWKGSELTFHRTGASGRIQVEESWVRVEVDLGLIMRPMKATIESEIRKYLGENLA
jgi:putative polyhydroxyalkanoate system protein